MQDCRTNRYRETCQHVGSALLGMVGVGLPPGRLGNLPDVARSDDHNGQVRGGQAADSRTHPPEASRTITCGRWVSTRSTRAGTSALMMETLYWAPLGRTATTSHAFATAQPTQQVSSLPPGCTCAAGTHAAPPLDGLEVSREVPRDPTMHATR